MGPEVSAVVDVAKEAAKAVTSKDVIDPRKTDARASRFRSRRSRRAIHKPHVKKTSELSASSQSSAVTIPRASATSTGTGS